MFYQEKRRTEHYLIAGHVVYKRRMLYFVMFDIRIWGTLYYCYY